MHFRYTGCAGLRVAGTGLAGRRVAHSEPGMHASPVHVHLSISQGRAWLKAAAVRPFPPNPYQHSPRQITYSSLETLIRISQSFPWGASCRTTHIEVLRSFCWPKQQAGTSMKTAQITWQPIGRTHLFLRERGGTVRSQTFNRDRAGFAVVTCAGMEATTDVALAVIGRHISGAAKMTVADIMLHESIRDFSSMQPFSGARNTATGDEKLDQCIKLMQANIEEPLPINQIVDMLHVSNRSLERKFKATFSVQLRTAFIVKCDWPRPTTCF